MKHHDETRSLLELLAGGVRAASQPSDFSLLPGAHELLRSPSLPVCRAGMQCFLKIVMHATVPGSTMSNKELQNHASFICKSKGLEPKPLRAGRGIVLDQVNLSGSAIKRILEDSARLVCLAATSSCHTNAIS